MQIGEIIRFLETLAPLPFQESYDNAGLIVGDPSAECTGVVTCLDSTEAVVEEAIQKGCNLIVAHHPIVFRGLKKLTGSTYVERVIIKAIRQEIAIYAIHTNLDNVLEQGVNARFGERLGLVRTRILAPKATQAYFVLTSRAGQSQTDLMHLKNMGATQLDTISGLDHQIRILGHIDKRLLGRIREAFPGQELSPVREKELELQIGSGLIGELSEAMDEMAFLQWVAKQMKVGCIRHTSLLGKPVKKVALCGGAGGFLLPKAISEGADIFLTSDYKYHEFFDADGKILLADIGHYESEQFTIALLFEVLSAKFPNFAFYSTEVNTNPVNYLLPEE